MLFYSDTKPKGKGRFSQPTKEKALKYLDSHCHNRRVLNFIACSRKSSFELKRQAEIELAICERKIAYWQRYC